MFHNSSLFNHIIFFSAHNYSSANIIILQRAANENSDRGIFPSCQYPYSVNNLWVHQGLPNVLSDATNINLHLQTACSTSLLYFGSCSFSYRCGVNGTTQLFTQKKYLSLKLTICPCKKLDLYNVYTVTCCTKVYLYV